MKIQLMGVGVLAVLFTAACGTASSDISVQDAWVRPAVVAMVGSPSTDDMSGMEMTQEPTMSGMDMGSSDSGGANLSAAFMTIQNKGGQADKLVSAETDAAGRVEIHQTTIENDIARMAPVDAIEIPANGTVELRPGGYHIMLMDLKRDLVAGDSLAITLTFASGKQVTVEAAIQEQAP